MKVFIKADDTGRVVRSVLSDKAIEGFCETHYEAIPEPPSAAGLHVLMFDGTELYYNTESCEEPTVPEPEAPSAPTHDEVEAARAAAYRQSVDPITCEIQRLRDMGGTAEEIAEAEERRKASVAAIKEQYPYPEVTNG